MMVFVWVASLNQIFAAEENLPDVYVSNHLVGKVFLKNKIQFISLEGLNKATKAGLEIQDSDSRVKVGGNCTNIKALKNNDTWLVPVKEIAGAIGYQYQYNPDTGIIDLSKLAVMPGSSVQGASRPRHSCHH